MIDVAFDVRTDAGGHDPDKTSPTLRRYHKILWSKPLPGGSSFLLDDTTPGVYLHHRSDLGEFFLSSDSVMQTFTNWGALKPITRQLPEEALEAFRTSSCTIGSMMVFPSNRIDGKQTINGARGFNRQIADRMDLTLECIRRHYQCEENPLGSTLRRYHDFFALFRDFSGYVEFFLLQDLVTADYASIRFFMPFDNFQTPAVPQDVESYRQFRHLSIAFSKARNIRIARHVRSIHAPSSKGLVPSH